MKSGCIIFSQPVPNCTDCEELSFENSHPLYHVEEDKKEGREVYRRMLYDQPIQYSRSGLSAQLRALMNYACTPVDNIGYWTILCHNLTPVSNDYSKIRRKGEIGFTS